MNTMPQELNWVEKRASCTIAKVFNQLCDGIAKDVAAINTARQLSNDSQFMAQLTSDGSAVVVGQPNIIPRRRTIISAANDRIAVNQEWNGEQWSVTVGLNNEGRCVLRLNEAELEQWQFRKKALEGLFFGD